MSTVLITLNEASEFIQPILNRLKAIEETQSKNHSTLDKVFSDKEAAFFLRVSTKKLQTLRNKREIGFVRELEIPVSQTPLFRSFETPLKIWWITCLNKRNFQLNPNSGL